MSPRQSREAAERPVSSARPTPRHPAGNATYTVICDCGFYALCWSPTGGGRLDTCPSCEGLSEYAAFTYYVAGGAVDTRGSAATEKESS